MDKTPAERMREQILKSLGLTDLLNEQVFKKKKPFLGICLGLQLLAKKSYEHGVHQGLGWIDGEVIQFKLDGMKLKLPHMGWNEITLQKDHPIFKDLSDGNRAFYFVHSYHLKCDDAECVTAFCEYGYKFPAVICESNIVATQFHPEKSQDNGMQLLENFINWKP